MATEKDIWQAAFIIAENYGEEGVAFAQRMAESFEIGGKTSDQAVWLAIMEKVSRLTAHETEAPGVKGDPGAS
jgi:hypothetical protein